MPGREAKHARIAQYAKHEPCHPDGCWCLGMTTSQGSGYGCKILQVSHIKKAKEMCEPEISNEALCHCGLERVAGGKKYEFCSSTLYQSIERSVREGELDPYLANLLSVLSV